MIQQYNLQDLTIIMNYIKQKNKLRIQYCLLDIGMKEVRIRWADRSNGIAFVIKKGDNNWNWDLMYSLIVEKDKKTAIMNLQNELDYIRDISKLVISDPRRIRISKSVSKWIVG